MNIRLYEKLMKRGNLAQHPPEWRMFLETCDAYLKKHKIKSPVVVELGVLFGAQKAFYEQLFGARHIGIDLNKRSTPDILGNTHSLSTLKKLKKMLQGERIDILFIDAGHYYESVKQDFEMYAPLCNGIVAFHDIERNKGEEVYIFWNELIEISYTKFGKYEDYLFLSIRQARFVKRRTRRLGIGVMIKR